MNCEEDRLMDDCGNMGKLISIVIANYNHGRYLGRAIGSVVGQCRDAACAGGGKDLLCCGVNGGVELIVCDGGSTDDSVEVIKGYAGGLPPNTERESAAVRLDLSPSPIAYWCSERDSGQSEAFNKGFSHAHGRFLTWLNADDVLLPGALARLVEYAQAHKDAVWFSAETVYVDAGERIVSTGLAMPNWLPRMLHVPSWARITAPATFFTKDLLLKAGGVDEDLHYVMDTDLWMKFERIAGPVRYTGFFAWAFRLHEQSKTSGSVLTGMRDGRFLDERARIRARMGITPMGNWLAYFGKRLCCLMCGSYVRRWLFLRHNGQRSIAGFDINGAR